MSAKAIRSAFGPVGWPSNNISWTVAHVGQKGLRRRTGDVVLEEQRRQAALDEWERWTAAGPFRWKANR